MAFWIDYYLLDHFFTFSTAEIVTARKLNYDDVNYSMLSLDSADDKHRTWMLFVWYSIHLYVILELEFETYTTFFGVY
jgi:hypothetical protein